MKKDISKKGLVIGIIILFVGASIVQGISGDNGDIIWVDDDNTAGPWDGTIEHPYRYIQDGVDAANAGDEIHVSNGTYYENLIIEKEVELHGGYEDLIGHDTDGSIIDGKGLCNVVYIRGMGLNNVLITGFTIQNSIENGIFVDHSGFITISENIIKNNYRGIFLFHSNDDVIRGNTIFENEWAGINLEATDHSTITQNYIYNNTYGVPIYDNSVYNTIILNEIKDNDLGLEVVRARGNKILENNFIGNGIQSTFKNGLNSWRGNYWRDQKFELFYIIWGIYESLAYPRIKILIPQIDLHPTLEPYNISQVAI